MVLFDLDGTLLPMDQDKFMKAYFGGLARRLAPMGYDPDRLVKGIFAGTAAMAKNTGKKTNEDVFWEAFSAVCKEDARADEPYFYQFYVEEFDKVKDSCGYDAKAALAVRAIKDMGFRVALATNPLFPSIATEKRISWCGLDHTEFELFTTYENSSYCKPNLDYYRAVIGKLGVKAEDVISHDLFLYIRDDGRTVGANGELLLSPRLDDLECVYSSLEAFLDSKEQGMIPVLAVFDNEEVGSDTKQGAASTFLFDTLSRIYPERDEYLAALASSYMVSADNAHAKHPNHPELSDADNAPTVNGGVVVKFNANQKYTTDSVSAAIFTEACRKAGVKYQTYYNRADMPGGSTLGSIANTKVSISTVDVGLPQLAMHSAVETAGAYDLADMIAVLTRLYSSNIDAKGDKIVIK